MHRLRKKNMVIFAILLILALCAVLLFNERLRNGINEYNFQHAVGYWKNVKSEAQLDPEQVVGAIKPLVNENGVEYLLDKAQSENVLDQRVALICLIGICEIIEGNPNNSQAENIRGKITSSEPVFKMIQEWKNAGLSNNIFKVQQAF